MGTSGTFEIVRTPASYIVSRSGHGKWVKMGSFRISANYSNAKFFKRYPGYAIGKLTSRAFCTRGGFCCFNFFKPELVLLKVKRVWNFSNVGKIKKPFEKKTRLNFAYEVLPLLNQHQNITIWPTLIQYGSLKRKIVAVSFFLTPQFDNFFFWNLTQLWLAITRV